MRMTYCAKEHDGCSSKRKCQREGKDQQTDCALYNWFQFICLRNVPVNGPILMHKTNSIAQAAGHDFKAFKEHKLNISFLAGDAAEVHVDGAHQFHETTMQLLLKLYRPQDIYNANETAIYFRALPGNTYVYKSCKKTVRGFKTAQDHVTLMVACNMSGDKEDLLLIGKAGSPRCFKNVKMFPIQYNFSTNAWMTEKIYGRWLRSWDRCLQESGRQVVVLLDNCFSGVVIDDLKNITLKFLPPNTMSVLQPCDMGIIKTLKAYFKHEM
ncbi:tigger transposable element-derived protein 4-like [Octopus bimaculoides]|uniref:tigger transposable element-derived protein 4-like n=1 Tax=Octopus bimaculoides TaxID=37653 RepID=UPI0022E2B694|nr:tigger transposable element-derived protein 4-like [Octopus bimaculoides]